MEQPKMKQILIIESSPRGAQSASRQLTGRLRKRLKVLYPDAKLIEHDLATNHLPHLDYQTVKAIFTKDQSEAESLKEALRLSDQLTDEFAIPAWPTLTI
jgi:FMN-dependent NADH-azoreductase